MILLSLVVTLDFAIAKNSPPGRKRSNFGLHAPNCLVSSRTFANISSNNNNNNNNEPFCGRSREKRGLSLRSSRNKLRPHTRVRSRPRLLAHSLARSLARFILSPFIAESCLPPFFPLFLYTSFCTLPLDRHFSGMQTVQNQPMRRSDVDILLSRKLMTVGRRKHFVKQGFLSNCLHITVPHTKI